MRLVAGTLVLLTLGASRIVAQCPDGTPPPCRGARRPNPPLDAKTWIIVPFDNIAHVAEIDWLRDASVNLLYLDMSKWLDIRVIDDERVADFIRQVPEARGGQALTLQSGIAVARRAGAGKLVMGDLLKVGARTQVVAKVFDVRTGQRLRTVRQDAPVADSIMPVFGLLARGVLDLEPPGGTSLGAIGTTRIDAYQEYLEGVRDLNAFDLPEAQRHLERAIQLDSSFALAHYKLSIVIAWENRYGDPAIMHAQAAVRLAAALPARERALISGQLALASGDFGRACVLYAPLLRADSNDVEALYNFGECNYHDMIVEPWPDDTTRLAFRGSWNASLRAFRRVLALDPTYHLAFQHVQDVLLATIRLGCLPPSGESSCAEGSNSPAVVRRQGDSIETVPFGPERSALVEAQAAAARRDHSRERNLQEARLAALEWVLAGPEEPRAKLAYGRILLLSGQVDSADAVLRRIPHRPPHSEQTELDLGRIEAALKRGRETEAVELLDSLRAEHDSSSTDLVAAVFGQLGGISASIERLFSGEPTTVRYFAAQLRALEGLPVDSLLPLEEDYVRHMTSGVGARRARVLLLPTLAWFDFRERGARWPSGLDTLDGDSRVRLVAVVATGDTARIRRALVRYDSTTDAEADEPDYGLTLLSVNAHLLLGDSAVALQRLRRFRDVTWRRTPMLAKMATGWSFSGTIWARSFLLLGDLAAAQGQRPEAVQAYRRFTGMWAHADPEAQPLVQRARNALAQLGN